MMGNALRFVTCLALAVAAGLFAGCARPDEDAEVVEVRTAVYPADGGRLLVVELARGTIEIRGESGGNEIGVTTTLRAWGATSEEAQERLEAVDFDGARIADGLHLRLRVSGEGATGHVGADFVVRVPLGTSIRVIGGNVGVMIQSMSGALDVTAASGDVIVRGANVERLAIESEAGDIEFAGRLAVGAVHEVRTDRGDVHVRIPIDSRLQIEAVVSSGGLITSSLPLFGDRTGREWSATLNGPDAALRLRTLDGQILIGRLHET